MQLTDEQHAIVERSKTGDSLKVLAFAGTGKTSTLQAVADAMPRRKMLYLAFNKSIQTEASGKFPAHVECRTAHSFAYRAVGFRYRDRLGGRLWGKDLAEREHYSAWGDREPVTVANSVLDTVRRFEHSADDKIGRKHVPRIYLASIPPDREHERTAFLQDIVRHATSLWEQLIDTRGTYPITHDTYLKLWQLQGPRLPYDTILFDEAQDASPVMLDVVTRQQGAQWIWVGDPHQQIYSWRGAVDALERVQAPAFPISQSFRFGPAVANLANEILAFKGETTKLKGFDAIPTEHRCLRDSERPRAVLCRTNIGLIDVVVKGLNAKHDVAVIGGTADAVRQIRALYDLRKGDAQYRRFHALIAPFNSWEEFATASETNDGAELRPLVNLANTYQHGLPRIADRLETCRRDDRGADLVVSTVHKAKGREWDRVSLANDFRALVDDEGEPVANEEVNLLYVAATRAQRVIDTSDCSAVNDMAADKLRLRDTDDEAVGMGM